jgi:ubiquitin carboxyl-terminal hydrolase 2/21
MEQYYKVQLENYDIKNKQRIYRLNSGVIIYEKNDTLFIPKTILNENVLLSKPKIRQEERKEDITTYNKYLNLNNINPCGLYNIGGVCYMNAVLQCFFYCRPLTYFFLNLSNYEKYKLESISKGYLDFVEGLSKGNKYAAQNFKKVMIEKDNIFYGTEGKDSKDVALLILTEIHNELKKNKDNEIINLNKKVNHYILGDVYDEKLELDRKNDNETIISKTFNFCMKYEQRCQNNCPKYKNTYFTIETDNILLLELDSLFYKPNIRVSVEECLEEYVKEKIIECPSCKKNALSFRNIFCTLPEILILVLSRGYHNKFKCEIEFNETLNMNEYFEPINEIEKKKNTKYKLIGATFAYDWTSEGTGHTIAFCKTYKQNNYYVFNDKYARKTDINEINGKLPYLLFYEKQD